MESRFDICALGTVAWDLLGTVEQFPAPDEKMQLTDFIQQGGGRAGTAAAAVAKLGGKVAVFGCVGDDSFGDYIREGFAKLGVNSDGLQVVPGENSLFAFCAAEMGTGKRTIFYKHGSMPPIGARDIDTQALTDCRCLLVDSHHPGASIAGAQAAQEKGVPVVLDAEEPHEAPTELLALIDYVIIPESLLVALGDGDADKGRDGVLALDPIALIVTRGAQGADVYHDNDSFHQPAFKVPQVVDTTGAGDVFHGAFAYGVVLGYDLADNVAFASAAAALSTTALGGRGHLPSLPEVKALMHSL